jgi:hypothetical protein
VIDTAAVLKAMADSGALTASRLVAEAQALDHPLHPRFQWDDTAAAHEFRLMQARQMIVSVVVRPDGAKRAIPVFIHVPARTGEGEYVLTEFVVSRPDQWQLAREEALRYLKGAEENVAGMAEAMRLHGKRAPRGLNEATGLIRRAHTKVARA